MGDYHKYVFDEGKRIFLGRFETMYQQECLKNYDSWYQSNLNELDKKISLAIIDQYNFKSILDIGCGKGTFTHLLKKKNNRVTGIDISETAINKAKGKYPEIDFRCLDTNIVVELKQYFDLVLIMETLSYIEEWKKLLSNISELTEYLYLDLFLPDNPIGHVKSMGELTNFFYDHFHPIHKIIDETSKRIYLFGRKKQ